MVSPSQVANNVCLPTVNLWLSTIGVLAAAVASGS